jgi:hypothetical protein
LKNWYQEIDKIDSEKMRSASLIQDKAEGKQMFSLTKDNDELTVRETLLNLNEPNKFLISEASEFYHQYEQIKEFSKPLTSRINNLFLFIFKIHSGAIYTSRLLNRVSLYYPQKPHEEIENFCDDSTEELNKAVEKNPQMIVKKFRHLRSQIKQLKQGKSTTDDQMNLEQKYQKLKKIINSLLEEEQTRTREINALQSQPIITEELCKKLKKQKEEFSYLQKTNRELNEKLSVYENVHEKIKQKKQELKNLNQAIISKYQLDEDDSGEIEELLKAQARNDTKSLERTKKRILKWQTLTEAEIDTLCQVQVEIAK